MTEYRLYLESGPKRRTTMVHVPQLLGCMANGPTTEEALDATPEAIRAFLGFLKETGEEVDAEGLFTTTIVEHVTEGIWLGNGSPYVTYAPDLEPVSDAEVNLLANRYQHLRERLAGWAETQTDAALDTSPEKGRTARGILLHVLPGAGAYVSPITGGSSGYSRMQLQAERGEISLAEAIRQVGSKAADQMRSTTPEQCRAVIQRPKEIRTLRKALRRTLEHDWEHLRELSRRPGGPVV
jgi:predicted RNase H-like HicB family nuclease